MNALAFFRSGKLDHELAVGAVILVVAIMIYFVLQTLKPKGDD